MGSDVPSWATLQILAAPLPRHYTNLLPSDPFRQTGAIEFLPEIIEAVGGRVPVLVDSGFRRGTDLIKALAMGAQAVCVGRPYLWGLGAFGQPGVERVLDILRAETRAAMQQVGAPNVKALVPAMVRRA